MDIRDLDMDAIAKRYELTFARQNHDRPLMHLAYPTGKTVELPPDPPTPRERWLNYDWRIECYERQLACTNFIGEGFPGYFCNMGPDILAGFTGSEIDFSRDGTTWAKFRVTDWDDEPTITFQKHGWLWREMEKFMTMSAERGKGRWLTGSGDLHTNGDGLAALRGPQDLLTDLIDSPEEIKKRLAEFHEVFRQVLQAHFDIIHPRSGGMNTSWMSATCKGRYAVIQNDFCCMVGPEMFDEFFKEYVEKEAQLADHCIYHLDGPGAIRHVESICQSPKLDAIQWVPGDGNAPLCDWQELLQKIQSLGKGLWLYGSAEGARKMMSYLKPEGCMYNVWCSSREEAESLLRLAERR